MSDVTTPGRSAVADRPVKVCPGIEDRPCGKEIPAIRTRCEECSAERRKLKTKGYNSNYYQANQESLVEKQSARYRLGIEHEDCKIVIKLAAWIKDEMDRERDLQFGFDRPLSPAPYPKAYRGLRPPRQDRIRTRAVGLVRQGIQRGAERLNKSKRRPKHFPYRAPRLEDIQPATVTPPPRYKATIRKKRRGRPRLTAAQQIGRFERRRKRAVSLFIRVYHEKMAPDEAWYAVNPQSKASSKSATRRAKEEIAWICKEDPLSLEDHLYISGLYDFEDVCRGIKNMLNATLYRKGKPTDLPDWPARIKGLKLLMSYLGLATLRGFRSGPYAVGGELEHEALVGNGAPPGDEDVLADVRRRTQAEAIAFRNQFEGKPLADCWFEVNPKSEANRNTARKEAAKLVDWYQERYSSSLAERLIANGLNVTTVLTTLKAMKEATLVCDGARSDYPDWRVRNKALGIQMLLLGHYPPPGRSAPRRASPIPGAARLYGEEAPVATESPLGEAPEPPEPPAPPAPRSAAAAHQVLLAGLYWRHHHDGLPLADCCFSLDPDAARRYSEASAARIATGILGFFLKKYPMPLAALLEAHDLGFANLVEGIQEMSAATSPLKVTVTWREDADGSRRKETTYIQRPDNQAVVHAIEKQMILHGLGRDGWRRPRRTDDDQEPWSPPKSFEEAVARGKPYTWIEHPPAISQAQWDKEWAAYKAERKQVIEQYGLESDEYRAWLRRDID